MIIYYVVLVLNLRQTKGDRDDKEKNKQKVVFSKN
jgi:hypothetical protein